jgi:hypothetical protein
MLTVTCPPAQSPTLTLYSTHSLVTGSPCLGRLVEIELVRGPSTFCERLHADSRLLAFLLCQPGATAQSLPLESIAAPARNHSQVMSIRLRVARLRHRQAEVEALAAQGEAAIASHANGAAPDSPGSIASKSGKSAHGPPRHTPPVRQAQGLVHCQNVLVPDLAALLHRAVLPHRAVRPAAIR